MASQGVISGWKRDQDMMYMYLMALVNVVEIANYVNQLRRGVFFCRMQSKFAEMVFVNGTVVYMWAREYYPVIDVSEEAKVHIEKAIDIFQWLRYERYSTTKLL